MADEKYNLTYTGEQVESLLGQISDVISRIPTRVSQLTNDSGYVTSSSVPSKTSDLNNDSGFITLSSVPKRVSELTNDKGFATEDSVSAEEARATTAEENLRSDVDNILAKIPLSASAQNQLADKEFVNSSIATATATFLGTYNSLAELQAVSADENDYGYVRTTDAAGNTIFKRYKYASGSWVWEYDLNNSSFTASQWAAINSAISAELVAKLSALPDNATLTADLAAKQAVIEDLSSIRSKANSAYQKPSSGIPASDIADGVIPDIADNLATNDATKVLSAKQGKILKQYIDGIRYAECPTPAATVAKVVAADNFRLVPGVQFRVKFSQANTAANPTLNIGGTGALPIVYGGEAASATNSWEAGEVVLVYYDGTSWVASAAQGGYVNPILDGFKMSIVGDSISTFAHVSTGANPYYPRGGVVNVSQTWWYMVANRAKAQIAENLSAGGARVTGEAGLVQQIDNIIDTDLIFIAGGINDSTHGVPIGELDLSNDTAALNKTNFADAYLYCVRVAMTKAKQVVLVITNGVTDGYRDVIKAIGGYYNLQIADLSNKAIDYVDNGVHPGVQGHQLLSSVVIAALEASAEQGGGGEKTLPAREITDVQVQGYYNYTNGGFANNNTVVATRKIFVPHGFKVSVGAGYTYSVVMYDLEGNYVSGISWTGSETARKHQGYIVVNVRQATLDTPTGLRVTLTGLIFPDPVLIYDREASRVRDNAISALRDTLYSGTPVLLAPLPDYLQTFTDLNSGALVQRNGGTVECPVCGAFRVSVNAGYQFSLGKRANGGGWLGPMKSSFSQTSYDGMHTGAIAINVKNDAGTPLDLTQWAAAGLKIEIAELGILYRVADIESRVLPPSDGLYYSGEKLSMAGNRCKLESVNCMYPTSQGGASYNNYLFLSGAVPGVVLYNPDTKSFSRYATMSGIAYPATDYGAAHFNTMCFGRKKSADDDFPLLYVSQWNGNRGCIVYFVDTANSAYVPWQYIDISALSPSIVGQGNTDFIVDPDEQLLYLIRYKLDTPYDAEGNTNVITCFALPNESINGRIALTDADILWSDEYYREFIRQDSHFAAGKIYTGYGSGPNTGGKWVLTVYDTYLRRIVTIIDRSKESTLREIEAVVEIGGNLAVLNTGTNYIQFIY